MPIEILNTPIALPGNFCPATWNEAWEELINNYLTSELPSVLIIWNYGASTPAVEDRDKPWFKTEADGTPINIFNWDTVLGAWVSIQDRPYYGQGSGADPTYGITVDDSLLRSAGDFTGRMFAVKANFTNAGAANLQVTSSSSGFSLTDAIVMPGGASLSSGAITSGTVFLVVHDGTNWVLVNRVDPTDADFTEVYGSNSTPGATQDITLTKPTGTAWKHIELHCMGSYVGSAATGTSVIAFTYQTAPEAGTTPPVGAAAGTGNDGQIFGINDANDVSSPTWHYRGLVHTNLMSTDSIVVRATRTLSNCIQNSSVFTAVATYR